MSLSLLVDAVVIGVGASLVADLWAATRRHLFGVPPLDYRYVGRWLGHMPEGKFRHASIATADPVPGEALFGWLVHFLIGIGFALTMLLVVGQRWLEAPTLLPALVTGLLTAAAPFLTLQPAFGAGLFASRTPRPGMARLHTLIMHLVFGLGLYLSAIAWSWLN